jgi:hypothetical protein
MFLAWRDLKVGRGRFALVGVVIALVGLLTTLLSGLASGLVDDGISGLRGLPLTHLALQPGGDRSFSRSTLTEDHLGPWTEEPGVEVAPLGVSFFNARTHDGDTLDLAVFGTPPGSFLAPREDAQAALAGEPGLVLSEAFRDEGVRVGDETIPSRTVLWTAGVRPSPLAARLGVTLDRAGRVPVQPDCSLPGHPEVFVIGDMAQFVPAGTTTPLPGLSPVAIQMGRSVAKNIRRTIAGKPRETFKYFDKGILATIGRGRAIAQIRRIELTRTVAFLAWAFIHLWFLIGFRNRVVVFLDWIWSYIMSKHGARLITGRHLEPPRPAARAHDGTARAPSAESSADRIHS